MSSAPPQIQTLRKAVQKLESAKEELQRPEEDVMAFSICTQIRQSLNGLFRTYLSFRERTVEDQESLESLFNRCKAMCDDFGYLNISKVICNAGMPNAANEGCLGPTHCMSFEDYSQKVTFANSVKEIVFNQMRLSEKDLA